MIVAEVVKIVPVRFKICTETTVINLFNRLLIMISKGKTKAKKLHLLDVRQINRISTRCSLFIYASSKMKDLSPNKLSTPSKNSLVKIMITSSNSISKRRGQFNQQTTQPKLPGLQQPQINNIKSL
jgi:hypothetical protein